MKSGLINTGLLIVTLYPLLLIASAEVTCFDVGQGNCTLVLHQDHSLNVPALLVDGGSTAFKKFRKATFKTDQITAIVLKTTNYLLQIQSKNIIIVVSHPDIDHYTWMPDIIGRCKENEPGITISRIVLGGIKTLYNTTFQTFLDDLLPEEISDDDDSSSDSSDTEEDAIVEFLTKDNNTTNNTILYENGNICYYILPALQGATKPASNAASLVVVVKFDNFVMPIMGDATGSTTKHITENEANFIEEETLSILHAAHHGSDTHESNSETWLNKIKPTLVVFSSGVGSKNMHPRKIITKRIKELFPEAGNQYRALHVGNINNPAALDLYGKGSLGYGLTVTQDKIYSTLSDGTITFSYLSTNNPPINCLVESDIYDSIKSCAMKALMKFPRGLLQEEHLTEVNLSNLHIDDNIEEDKNTFHKLIDSLGRKASQLKRFIIAHNHIGKINSLKKIFRLIISENNHINYLDLSNNKFKKEDLKKFKEKNKKRTHKHSKKRTHKHSKKRTHKHSKKRTHKHSKKRTHKHSKKRTHKHSKKKHSLKIIY